MTLHILTLLLVLVVVVQFEADQSDLLFCLVALGTTDPDVAVVGEKICVARLLHHFLLDGIHDVGGHIIS